MEIGTAGIPIDLANTRNYDEIFSTLAASGIDVYFPTSIYEEIPEIRTLNHELDFVPPPFGAGTAEIYELAREHGIKIAFSADYLFPHGVPADLNNSPLQAIIDAGGRDIIHSLVNYDEPVLNGIAVSASQAVYEHVKLIDDSIQVIQIHAPVTTSDATKYLEDVKDHANWADVVGFDVYPVGGTVSGARTPQNPDKLLPPKEALEQYVEWLKAEFPSQQHIMVLQAFEQLDLYSDAAVATMSAADLALSRKPTLLEMREMMLAVQGVDMAFWWGAALQNTVNEPVWDSLLNVSLLASLDDLGTPVTALIDIDLGENSLDEDASIGSFVGIKLSADDPDAIDRVTYSVDDDRFVVDELGVVRTNANFDFEAEDSVTFTATASSTDGSTVDQSFTISIKDVVDQTTGTNGSDALFGQSGDDSILGWGGDDLIEASTGNDIVDGQDGNDFIYGGAGDDTLSGGAGQDAILGGLGNDWINGGADFDYIVSGSGDDQIFGGEGDDQIVAESGSNTLAGGQGTDILQSGMDDDYFEFSAGDGTDYIFGFDVAEDVLAFSGGITMADLDVSTFNNVTLVDYDGGTAILFDVTEASLSAQNFDFI